VEDYDNNSSTAGDVLRQVNGQRFTAKNKDNDGDVDNNCAKILGGGFWYNRCKPNQVPILPGLTAVDGDFRWGNERLQSARMFLLCQ